MHIVLVEPQWSGHHRLYLESFAKVLMDMKQEVTILTKTHVPSCNAEIIIIPYRKISVFSKNSLLKKIEVCLNLFCTILNIKSISKSISKDVDIVFFCSMDGYMHELMPVWLMDILFPYKFSGLLLSPREGKKWIFDKRKILRSRHCMSIGVLDEFCATQVRAFQPNIVHFPDFADDSAPNEDFELVREIEKRANGRKIIILIGGLVTRKGFYTLIKASKLLPKEDYFIVIAGHCTFLENQDYLYIQNNFAKNENCCFYGKRIPTEADFNAIINISDIIYAAYINFTQSSNMFAKSCLFKKTIIVSKGSYMEEIINKYGMGLAINQSSEEDCAKAILYITKHADSFLIRQKEYLDKNSFLNIKDSFEQIFKYRK